MNHLRCIVVGLLLAVVTPQAMAVTQTVYYTSANNGGHRKANDQPLEKDTFIELGSFVVGFEPTAQNRVSWKANWTAAGRVAYDIGTQNFDGVVNLTENNAPFTPNNKVWVWVFDRSGNWALFSNEIWTWPDTTDPFPSFPLQCTPSTATITVAGTRSNANPRIVCELVTDAPSPAVTYTDWANLMLPEGSRGKTTDYDADGQNNFVEYAYNTDPASAASVSSIVKVKNYSSENYLAAEIRKGWTTGFTYTVQWSDNLSDWYDTGLTTVTDTVGFLEVRDANPLGHETKRFMRVRINSPD